MSVSPSSHSVKRKAWDLNPHDPKVARFSKPARRAVSGYLPYVFKCQWTDRELNPDFRHARAVSSRWTISPFVFSGPHGSRTHHTDLARVSRPQRHAGPSVVLRGPSGSRTRSPSLPRTCAAGTPTDHFSRVIPAGIEPALSWHVTQASSPLDHGIVVSDRGRSRTCKIATLSTLVTALPVCVLGRSSGGSGGRTRQFRLMRPE